MTVRIDGTNTSAAPGITGADTDTGVKFGTNEVDIVTGGTDRLNIGSSGDITIADGNLVVAAGHGIDFSANANAGGMTSELLDEYEEGTWIPVVEGSSSNPSITYSNRIGEYVRVGKLVTVNCSISAQYTGGGGGSFLISGLPFPVKTAAGTGGSVATNFIAIPANAACVTSEVRNNTSSFYAGLVSIEGGFSWQNLAISNLPSGGFNYRVQMSYYTD